MSEKCQRCNEEGEDRRTLWMACMYEMMEMLIPFNQESIREIGIHAYHLDDIHNFYTLYVCKDCRADWMTSIQEWFNKPKKNRLCGSGIFIRDNGTNLEITEEEFKKLYPNKTPIRVIKNV